jgi:hypothetical protein
MPGRSFNPTIYSYGFGGQLKDDEISGSGNSYTAEFWQYDPRLGRRWNTDQIVKPWESSYATFGNNPIYFNDPFGLDKETATKKEKAKGASDSEGTGYSTDGNTRTSGKTTQTLDKGCDCYVNSPSETTQAPESTTASAASEVSMKGSEIISSTHTVIERPKVLFELSSKSGDYYSMTTNLNYQNGQHKAVNLGTSTRDGAIQPPDISLNIGPSRATINANGTITGSVAVGNTRYGFSFAGDFVATFSLTYRANNGFGATTNFLYRPGGYTITGVVAAAAILTGQPYVIPALREATKLIPAAAKRIPLGGQ